MRKTSGKKALYPRRCGGVQEIEAKEGPGMTLQAARTEHGKGGHG
jgi:hypothetical protein